MLFGSLPKLTVCAIFASIATAGTLSYALEPSTPLGRLARQSWSVENGLPQNTIQALLQSRNGYLWVGTELGLARFDGVSFRVFDHATIAPFPDAEIRCMLDAPDPDNTSSDSLWVGTGDGLVRLVNGRPTVFTTHDGLPGNSIRGLAQTADHTVWIWTEQGLAHWDGRRLQAVAAENGLPRGEITSMAADSTGGIWVGTTAGAAVFRQGHWHRGLDITGASDVTHVVSRALGQPSSDRASLVAPALGGDVLISDAPGIFLEHNGGLTQIAGKAALPGDGVSFLTRLSDGTVVIGSKSSVVLVPKGVADSSIKERFTVSKQLPGSRIESIYADRENCLWVGTNRGLVRINDQKTDAVQLLPPTDPLAASAVVSIMEDQEGDLWVGTETAGLHILRDARFRAIGAGEGLSSDATTAIVEDAHNGLWIGTRDGGLNHVLNDDAGNVKTSNLTTANGLLSNVILALAAGRGGDLWVGTPDGLNHIAGNKITSFTSAEGLPDDFIRSLLIAPDDTLWIATRRGLTHLDHGHFQNLTQADGLGSDLVGALARTPDGDLWIATLQGLSRLHQGTLHNYTTADGLSSNVITALDVTPDGMIWIGTQDAGLNVWDGKRFMPIHDVHGDSNPDSAGRLPTAIHAVLHDDREHLWLASDLGLARADMHALLECAAHQACRLDGNQLADFTTADGLRSRNTSSNSHPTACRARDGRLWFTTPRGVITVDPLHFAELPQSPPVVIERFAADDNEIPGNQLIRIAAGHLRFQFDYAGLSFASPQKLRYQYMLEGFDHSWTDAGTRRTAFYTNIPPGNYRFRVRAAFGDRRISPALDPASEAAISFDLLPHFYQTMWFIALVILLVAGLLLLLFRSRVLRVEREFRAVMGERNRIAREIHDTLAQGYVGISLQLEILGELLRHNRTDAAAKHLALTQGLVREGLDDARQSIWALRSQDAGEQALPIRLRRLVEKAQDRKLSANLEIHGAYRALSPDVEQEILRIAQEAIQNVKKHAEASSMDVRLDYDEHALAMSVSDNGRGFLVAHESAGSKATKPDEGHYGLVGIRERAALIHGAIEIVSKTGSGTTIRLHLPAPEVPTRSRSGTATGPDPSIETVATEESQSTIKEQL
jgi:signal transduction histidine kinase/ligand-binding sensor domain-containing protein